MAERTFVIELSCGHSFRQTNFVGLTPDDMGQGLAEVCFDCKDAGDEFVHQIVSWEEVHDGGDGEIVMVVQRG